MKINYIYSNRLSQHFSELRVFIWVCGGSKSPPYDEELLIFCVYIFDTNNIQRNPG